MSVFMDSVNRRSRKQAPFYIFAERRRQARSVGLTSVCYTALPARRGRGPSCVWYPAVSAKLYRSNILAKALA